MYAGGQHYEEDGTYSYLNDILEFKDGSWKNVGAMSSKRSYHAVSIVNYLEIDNYCMYYTNN